MKARLVMDGRPQSGFKDARLLVIFRGRKVWLSSRCFALFRKIVKAKNPISYRDLADSAHDRPGEVMYQLRKQLKVQNGPKIEVQRRNHYAYFEVSV